jgi:hypothetical protein
MVRRLNPSVTSIDCSAIELINSSCENALTGAFKDLATNEHVQQRTVAFASTNNVSCDILFTSPSMFATFFILPAALSCSEHIAVQAELFLVT